MRLDPDHVRKLARAIKRSPPPEVNLDIAFMRAAMDRLSLWERGLFMDALMRAAGARRRTLEQRALLALFVHPGDAP
jgi:hypothetical protein